MLIFLILFFILANFMLISGQVFPDGELEGNAIAIIIAIVTIVVDSWIIFKIGQEISERIGNNKFKKLLPKIISIFLICTICALCIYGMLPKCDLCENISTKSVYDYNLCQTCYNRIEEKVENDDSSDYTVPDSDYRRTVGMNGTIRYRCTKTCTEQCGNACKSCINRMLGDSDKCTFEYDFSQGNDYGWIGCRLCGDVDNEYWCNWYREKLGLD